MTRRLTDEVHEFLRARLRPGDWVVDATVGNGHDTLALVDCVAPGGAVVGFDVQAAALRAAEARVAACAGERDVRVRLLESCHSTMGDCDLPQGGVAAVVFNLGYLPGGDHAQTTSAASSVRAIEAANALLREGGVLSVLAYTGHAGGADEALRVEQAIDVAPELAWIRRDPRHGARPRLFLAERLAVKSCGPCAP